MSSKHKDSHSKMMDTKKIVIIALLSAIAFVLMTYAKLPIKYLGFLEVEVSDVPALVAAIAYGPVAGIVVELFKNLLHLPLTSTGGVGELANFIVMASYVIPIGIFGKRKKIVPGFVLGVTAMVVAGIAVNNYITVPFYMKICGEDIVYGMVQGTIPFIDSKLKLVLIGITPFNVVKGIMDSVVGYYVWKVVKKVVA